LSFLPYFIPPQEYLLNGENRNRTCEAFKPSRFQGGVLDQPDSLQKITSV
jgi:hypothetical protein